MAGKAFFQNKANRAYACHEARIRRTGEGPSEVQLVIMRRQAGCVEREEAIDNRLNEAAWKIWEHLKKLLA